MWTQAKAVALARELEMVCIKHHCHIALTGGLLYKDADFIIYRDRDVTGIDAEALFRAFRRCGVVKTGGDGWCIKAQYKSPAESPSSRPADGIDFLFPEEDRHNLPHDPAKRADHYNGGDR